MFDSSHPVWVWFWRVWTMLAVLFWSVIIGGLVYICCRDVWHGAIPFQGLLSYSPFVVISGGLPLEIAHRTLERLQSFGRWSHRPNDIDVQQAPGFKLGVDELYDVVDLCPSVYWFDVYLDTGGDPIRTSGIHEEEVISRINDEHLRPDGMGDLGVGAVGLDRIERLHRRAVGS